MDADAEPATDVIVAQEPAHGDQHEVKVVHR